MDTHHIGNAAVPDGRCAIWGRRKVLVEGVLALDEQLPGASADAVHPWLIWQHVLGELSFPPAGFRHGVVHFVAPVYILSAVVLHLLGQVRFVLFGAILEVVELAERPNEGHHLVLLNAKDVLVCSRFSTAPEFIARATFAYRASDGNSLVFSTNCASATCSTITM